MIIEIPEIIFKYPISIINTLNTFYKINNFKNPDLSNTDLSILYTVYSYIKKNIEKYGR